MSRNYKAAIVELADAAEVLLNEEGNCCPSEDDLARKRFGENFVLEDTLALVHRLMRRIKTELEGRGYTIVLLSHNFYRRGRKRRQRIDREEASLCVCWGGGRDVRGLGFVSPERTALVAILDAGMASRNKVVKGSIDSHVRAMQGALDHGLMDRPTLHALVAQLQPIRPEYEGLPDGSQPSRQLDLFPDQGGEVSPP